MSGRKMPGPDTESGRGRGTEGAPLVLFTANAGWNIYNFRLGLMKFLRDEGWTAAAAGPQDPYADEVRKEGFSYYPVSFSRKGTNPFVDLGTFIALRRLYRHLRPRAVCHFTVKPNIYGTLAAASLGSRGERGPGKAPPAVLNNISGLGTVFISRSFTTSIVRLLYRLSQRFACRVFFQNEDDRADFLREALVKEERTGLLPGSGVDLEKFRPPDDGPGAVAGGASQAGVRFLLAARLLTDKGIAEYAEAARLLKAEYPDARFLLAGPKDPENRSAVDPAELERWRNEGLLSYLGNRSDVPALLAEADCVVLPSYREGTPRSLLEAAAAAKPLVASDVPGCRQTIDEGKSGYLCAPRDPRSLAGAMGRILELSAEERRKMGRAGREKMKREYDQALVFRAYRDALASCAGAAGGPAE